MLTNEQKIEMARAAGFAVDSIDPSVISADDSEGVCSAEVFALIDAAYSAGLREGLERAAKVCDEIEDGSYPDGDVAAGLAWECAAAIRAQVTG